MKMVKIESHSFPFYSKLNTNSIVLIAKDTERGNLSFILGCYVMIYNSKAINPKVQFQL